MSHVFRDDILELDRLDEDASLLFDDNEDKRDIESETVVQAIKWELLEKLATGENEAQASALNARCYAYFKANYDDYVRRFRP